MKELGFTEDGQLTATGRAFEEAVLVYDDEAAADRLFHDALLGLPATQALLQALHGRGPVSVSGTHYVMARHGFTHRDDPAELRRFLLVLNRAGVVAYSAKLQTVRVLVPVPEELAARLRVVEPERPYSNVLALRETLRACENYIWWAELHLSAKALEPLSYEADAERVREVRLLSGPANANEAARKDFKRFAAEMSNRGIRAEWRIVAKSDLDWHDRYIVADGRAWNVPPVNTLYKGDYSDIARTRRPPYEEWWERGVPLDEWVALNPPK